MLSSCGVSYYNNNSGIATGSDRLCKTEEVQENRMPARSPNQSFILFTPAGQFQPPPDCHFGLAGLPRIGAPGSIICLPMFDTRTGTYELTTPRDDTANKTPRDDTANMLRTPIQPTSIQDPTTDAERRTAIMSAARAPGTGTTHQT